MVERASSGTSWKTPKASDWNAIGESTEWVQRRMLGQGGSSPRSAVITDIVQVQNSSGAARRPGDVLQIGSPALDDLVRQHPWFDGIAPAAPLWTACHGVLLGQTPAGEFGELQLSGCCVAHVNVTDTTHRRCDVAAGSYVLQSRWAGPWQILHPVSTTGEQLCFVALGPKRPSSGVAKLSGTLAAGSPTAITSASAALQKRSTAAFASAGQSITVYSYYATAIDENAFCNVEQDEAGDWWVTTKDCS